MSIDESDLLAYADGSLSSERMAEIEAAVARSPELAARLAAMRASALPYRAAYEAQPAPPLPARLTARVAELIEANSGRPRARKSWPRLVAAFAAGVVCCAVSWTILSSGRPLESTAGGMSPWIHAVADYQQLYSRETLANVTEDHRLSDRVISELQVADGMSVRVPDLRSAGLIFKRVQRLSFHQQPVVQMVYLPEQGDPIALCATRDARPNEEPHVRQIDELITVSWRRGNLGYVLLGRAPAQSMLELAQRLARGETGTLYGRGGDPGRSTAA
ncbi:MAG: anti-sigma factor [Gammaproteobacteria bacterium]|nr:anti-sigma factor [Gammaproteobacteria bacterium]